MLAPSDEHERLPARQLRCSSAPVIASPQSDHELAFYESASSVSFLRLRVSTENALALPVRTSPEW